MSIQSLAVTPALRRLHEICTAEGEEIVFVGGCVRDALRGEEPKDIDLATSADPTRQLEIYNRHGIMAYGTGISHGTYTVAMGEETYEITSFRRDVHTDGRHAEVEYTRDLTVDLGRRDLTINAMAADFDGRIIDPFDGQGDLSAKRVRFVGDPSERIIEDHLRILRFLRFHHRFAPGRRLDTAAENAIIVFGHKLVDISAERIWSEVSRIIAHEEGPRAMRDIGRLDLNEPCRLPLGSWREVARVHAWSRDPVTLMVAYLGDKTRIEKLADDWRWSAAERKRAIWLAENLPHEDADYHRLIARYGNSLEAVVELAILQGRDRETHPLRHWQIPTFPLRGRDLVAAGVPEGPEVGAKARWLKDLWADSDYTLTRDDLLARIAA